VKHGLKILTIFIWQIVYMFFSSSAIDLMGHYSRQKIMQRQAFI